MEAAAKSEYIRELEMEVKELKAAVSIDHGRYSSYKKGTSSKSHYDHAKSVVKSFLNDNIDEVQAVRIAEPSFLFKIMRDIYEAEMKHWTDEINEKKDDLARLQKSAAETFVPKESLDQLRVSLRSIKFIKKATKKYRRSHSSSLSVSPSETSIDKPLRSLMETMDDTLQKQLINDELEKELVLKLEKLEKDIVNLSEMKMKLMSEITDLRLEMRNILLDIEMVRSKQTNELPVKKTSSGSRLVLLNEENGLTEMKSQLEWRLCEAGKSYIRMDQEYRAALEYRAELSDKLQEWRRLVAYQTTSENK